MKVLLASVALVLLPAFLLCGCATTPAADPPVAQSEASVGHVSRPAWEKGNDERLAKLWKARTKNLSDFPIGPGDVLKISAPGVHELSDRHVRVSGDGVIHLPLVGNLHVGGKTQSEVRTLLDRRLGKYLYHPDADIFVKSFSSRWVAVTGAVGKPGMYVLNGPDETIRQLIERAGGMNSQAGTRILLTPAGPGKGTLRPAGWRTLRPVSLAEKAGQVDADATRGSSVGGPAVNGRSRAPLPLPSSSALPRSPGSTAPVIIGTGPGAADLRYLNLPLRPGDTIDVPMAGSVTVIGWVQHPETIQITQGLTVLGAVSACGGPLFAAKMSSVKVIRLGANGETHIFKVNLGKVKDRQAPATLVEANDIVEVPYSSVRVPGYALYYAARGIFSWTPAAAVSAGIP